MPFTVKCFKVESEFFEDFQLLEDYPYYTEVRGKLEKVVLRRGSRTDLASIPQLATLVPGFSRNGRVSKPSILHDCGYHGTLDYDGQPFTRAEVDWMFLEAMENAGIDKTHREAIYDAVREFGQPAWDAGHAAPPGG